MKTGFSLLEILHREKPVFITGMGLQWIHENFLVIFLHIFSSNNVYVMHFEKPKIQKITIQKISTEQ